MSKVVLVDGDNTLFSADRIAKLPRPQQPLFLVVSGLQQPGPIGSVRRGHLPVARTKTPHFSGNLAYCGKPWPLSLSMMHHGGSVYQLFILACDNKECGAPCARTGTSL